jgi:class I fructose-bisphosphate aldolase
VVVWSYPRGKRIEEKGGRDSLYAIEYAARVAAELGADMVKLNMPDLAKSPRAPEPYRGFSIGMDDALKRIVSAACGIPVIFAGGRALSDNELLAKAQVCISSGASGLIFGRNIWQRPKEEALAIAEKIREIMKNAKIGKK